MAVDTRNKRLSLLGFAVPMLAVLPLADGAITQADRQQYVYCYPGILFDAASTLNLHTTKTSSLTATRTTRALTPTRTSGAI